MCDGVGAIILWHEFGYMGFSLAFVVAVAVLSREHYKVTNLVNIFWCTVMGYNTLYAIKDMEGNMTNGTLAQRWLTWTH